MDISDISRLAKHMPEISRYKFFFPDETIMEFARDLTNATRGEPFPISSRLPSERVGVAVENILLLFQNDVAPRIGKCIACACMDLSGKFTVIGAWLPGSKKLLGNSVRNQVLIQRSAYLFSLINEPRIVSRQTFGTRQQRRTAARGMGFAVDAWTRVTWDLSKETIAKISQDPDFHKVPLHWRRGHYRRAEPHFKGAHQRPDAIRPEDRDLWWQWIEEQWVGHPAFGIKKSVHAPKLSTGDIARRHRKPLPRQNGANDDRRNPL